MRGTRADGSAWGCRIVANPRGYFSKGEQAGFVPHCVLTVPVPMPAPLDTPV